MEAQRRKGRNPVSNFVRVLGLDIGETTGFAFVDITNGKAELGRYGIITAPKPVPMVTGIYRKALVDAVQNWLTNETSATHIGNVAMSEIVQMPRLPTSHAALEVQGACRLWGVIGYNPQRIHSGLGTRNKKQCRELVAQEFGVSIQPDHAVDALAAALHHAVQLGYVRSFHLLKLPEPKVARIERAKVVELDHEPTPEELVEMLRTGKARVAR